MRGRIDRLREERPGATVRHQWVPYRNISIHLKRAVIAAEDASFMEHRGFDWKGIRGAMEKNLREGEVVAGGSTITQQLAKNLFLSGDRAWWRKAQEAVIAVMIELVMDKRRILEIYLNVIEWGESVFGAEAAARHHFGVKAADLSAEQAARLAAMVPSPRRYAAGQTTASSASHGYASRADACRADRSLLERTSRFAAGTAPPSAGSRERSIPAPIRISIICPRPMDKRRRAPPLPGHVLLSFRVAAGSFQILNTGSSHVP